jgi:hypothetical protein
MGHTVSRKDICTLFPLSKINKCLVIPFSALLFFVSMYTVLSGVCNDILDQSPHEYVDYASETQLKKLLRLQMRRRGWREGLLATWQILGKICFS